MTRLRSADLGPSVLDPAAFIQEVAFLVEVRPLGDRLFAEIGEHLRRLAARPDLLAEPLAALPGTGASVRLLAQHRSGPSLFLARLGGREPGPVHDHGSWGVLCIISGRSRMTHWARLDAGIDRDRASVHPLGERILGPGDVAWFGGPPDDIVSHEGLEGDVLALAVFGRNPTLGRRTRFDTATGRVSRSGPA